MFRRLPVPGCSEESDLSSEQDVKLVGRLHFPPNTTCFTCHTQLYCADIKFAATRPNFRLGISNQDGGAWKMLEWIKQLF